MMKRRYAVLPMLLLLAAPAQAGLNDFLKEQLKRFDSGNKELDAETVAAGLREALEKGTQRAVDTLGHENGFWSHPTLRIPMPEKLQKVDKALRKLGQSRLADEFVHSLNSAAEAATPAARDIFVGAIRKMTLRDAMDILNGPPNAATQYFRRSTETSLTAAFKPIVTRTTESVGATRNYKRLVTKAAPLGIVDSQELDVDDYVTRKALNGLFTLIAEEERRIREDPVARTTELLRKVFR